MELILFSDTAWQNGFGLMQSCTDCYPKPLHERGRVAVAA